MRGVKVDFLFESSSRKKIHPAPFYKKGGRNYNQFLPDGFRHARGGYTPRAPSLAP